MPKVADVLTKTGRTDEFLDIVDVTRHMDDGRFVADRAVETSRVFDSAKQIGIKNGDDIAKAVKGDLAVSKLQVVSNAQIRQ